MKNLKTLDKYRDTEFERKYYGFNGDAGNGVFRVPVGGKMFNVVASTEAAGNMLACHRPTGSGRGLLHGRKCAKLSACSSMKTRWW